MKKLLFCFVLSLILFPYHKGGRYMLAAVLERLRKTALQDLPKSKLGGLDGCTCGGKELWHLSGNLHRPLGTDLHIFKMEERVVSHNKSVDNISQNQNGWGRRMVGKIFLLVGSGLVVFLTCQSVSGQGIKPNISISVEFSKAVPKEGDKIIIKAKVYNHTEKAIENILIQFFDGNPEKGQKIGEQTIPKISDQDRAEIQVIWIPIKNGLYCIYGVAKSGKDEAVAFKEIPVVTKNLYFAWWPGEKETHDKLKYANVALANKETVSYWKEKGAIPCVWKGTSKGKSADEYAQYLSKDVSEIGAAGIMLDEIGWYEKTPEKEKDLKGLEKFTKERPEIFTAVYICGSLKPEQCNLTKNLYRKQGIDLLMLESYFNYQVPELNSYSRDKYFDQRIEMARDYDVLNSCIMILGINDRPDIYTITPEDLESQFIYIRRNAPEMPGIGFYKAVNKEISFLSDKFCYKYFIAPVATTWERDILFSDYHPADSQKITIYANIYNIGGMDAKDITVKFYCGNPEERGKEIGKVVIPVLSPKEGVPSGATKISTQWKATKGYHHIYVEITSKDSDVTILEGQAKRLIFVR